MGGPPPPGVPQSTAKFFPRCFDVTTTKKGHQLFGGRKCTPGKAPPEKILATHLRKGPPPYVGMALRMVNPVLFDCCNVCVWYVISGDEASTGHNNVYHSTTQRQASTLHRLRRRPGWFLIRHRLGPLANTGFSLDFLLQSPLRHLVWKHSNISEI